MTNYVDCKSNGFATIGDSSSTIPRTIVAHPMGGLGNQLFIYAAAMSLSNRLNARLELDTASGFVGDNKYRREYLLDQFSITASIAQNSGHFSGLRGRLLWRLMKMAERHRLGGKSWAMIDESRIPARCNARKIYLFGYWQSEDYFKRIADVIRTEFRVRYTLPADTNIELQSIQEQEEPVALGIRRFNERPSHESAYVTELEFYHTALQCVAKHSPRAHVFVFTEDADWVRSNLRCSLPATYISFKRENRRAYEDLTVMQACRHFIFGNSTYHWWGAWLGERSGSQIFVDSRFAEANPRFYPTRWHRL